MQRLIAIEGALRDGALLPRWLPDLAYGYGEPVLLYYAPLAYLPALVVRLLGGSYVGSVAAAGGLAIVLSAVAMYLCARSLFGPLAATVAGVVYASLPYQLVDLYVRGALAETWAFVWLPLAGWCLVQSTAGRPPMLERRAGGVVRRPHRHPQRHGAAVCASAGCARADAVGSSWQARRGVLAAAS